MHSLDRKLDTLMRILRSEARKRQVRALLDPMSLERDNANWKTGSFIGAELSRYWPAECLGFAKSTGGHEEFFHSACFAGGARREVRARVILEIKEDRSVETCRWRARRACTLENFNKLQVAELADRSAQ